MLVYCLYQRKFTFAAIVEVAFSQPLFGASAHVCL